MKKTMVLLCVLLFGCHGAPDQGPQPACGPTFCESPHDCPILDIDCVSAVCDDGVCEYVNLATSPSMPIDPDSGLPVGKGCHAASACDCSNELCAESEDGTVCAYCDLLGVCEGGACRKWQAGPPDCH